MFDLDRILSVHCTNKCFSTRDCPEAQRWHEMPSLEACSDLETIDLHKQRYMIALHPSLITAHHQSLIRLKITQCSKLQSLPDDLGTLCHLQEVGFLLLLLLLLTECFGEIKHNKTKVSLSLSFIDNILLCFNILLVFCYVTEIQLDLTDSFLIQSLPESIGELTRYVIRTHTHLTPR